MKQLKIRDILKMNFKKVVFSSMLTMGVVSSSIAGVSSYASIQMPPGKSSSPIVKEFMQQAGKFGKKRTGDEPFMVEIDTRATRLNDAATDFNYQANLVMDFERIEQSKAVSCQIFMSILKEEANELTDAVLMHEKQEMKRKIYSTRGALNMLRRERCFSTLGMSTIDYHFVKLESLYYESEM